MYAAMSNPTPIALTFEHHHDGLGIGHCQPRLSWRFEYSQDTIPNWIQTAYEIEVTRRTDSKGQRYHVECHDSTLVPWPSEPLLSREAAGVRVRCFGRTKTTGASKDSEPTEWSTVSTVEVGLLARHDWQANFITSKTHLGPEAPLQPLHFVKHFTLPDDYTSTRIGRLYITALGVFEASINGKRTSDECMAPGWTSYRHRLSYRVHDVSQLLQPGENIIDVEVGEGWYAGQLGIQGGGRFLYGGHDVGVLAQLEIRSATGENLHVIKSDDSWQAHASAIQVSEIYNGEQYDARRNTREAWANIAEGIGKTGLCRALPWIEARLVAPEAPPVRIVDSVLPEKVFRSKSGKVIIDFGQNLVGKLRLSKVDLRRGESLTMRHAEVMENGELGTRPLRSAECTDVVISAGDPIYDWTPKFTYHGFRFVQVDGLPPDGETELLERREGFVALVMHSDLRRRGHFRCSNEWLNKLHANIVWSMRGNFFSIPTDCPQRAERLGWTGDINLFMPTASYLYDSIGMINDWVQDLAAEHLEEGRNGIPPLVCPDTMWTSLFPQMPQAIWDDTTILVPWTMFQYSNDKAILERQYTSMAVWLRTGLPRGPDGLWNRRWQLGDWLDPTAPPQDPGRSRTDSTLVADAYLVQVTRVMSTVCSILGKEDEASRYRAETIALTKAFQFKYITRHGNLMANSQTGLALAIEFDLYENEDQVRVAAAELELLVRSSKFCIATGFAGTPVITHALTKVGLQQLAYRMILEKTCPSWLYPITMGATTVWERWDSMLPDGSINPGLMTSFNHYALGSVADWMHKTIGGLSAMTPGWKQIKVQPIPGGNIQSAAVSFDGPLGFISCEWVVEDGTDFRMTLLIPPNSEAFIYLPTNKGKDPVIAYSGTHTFACQWTSGEWPPAKIFPPFVPQPAEDTIAE